MHALAAAIVRLKRAFHFDIAPDMKIAVRAAALKYTAEHVDGSRLGMF